MERQLRTPSRGALLLAVACLCAAALPAAAQYTPVYRPELTVTRAAGPIEIDGVLDDPGWRGAAVADNFAEHNPGDQTQPPVDTKATMTYDQDNLYVAFRCQDDPAEVRASFCQRDRIYQDDYVILCLDTFGDSSTAYEIVANPLGIQGDLFNSNVGGEDSRYDFIFYSAGRITEDGWIVEMAIPFSSLRFPDVPEQEWKVDFWRNRPRAEREQYSWAAYDRDESCWLCQWGTVRGVTGIRPGAGLEVMPAVVSHQAGSRNLAGRFDDGKLQSEASLGVKYAFNSSSVVEATVNPDFSQVESDAAQIDVNTKFALFYSEKRPFFQEGADLFSTWFNAVYTRSINDPFGAGKVTGRHGGTSYALLSAYDEHSPIILPFEENSEYVSNGKSWSNLLRVKQQLGGGSHLGVVATDRRYDGGGNGSLLGLDAKWRLNQTYQVEVQALKTFTTEPEDTLLTSGYNERVFDGERLTRGFDGESFDGGALYAGFEGEARNWDFALRYWDRSPTFRADNGFEVSNNSRQGYVYGSWLQRFEDSTLLDYVSPSAEALRIWNYDGLLKEETVRLNLSTRFRWAQTATHQQYMINREVFRGVSYDDVWAWHWCLSSQPSQQLSLGGSANYGHRVVYGARDLGRQTDLSFWFDLKPVDRLLIETSWSYAQSRHLNDDALWYAGYVARSKATLQVSRKLSTRLVVQFHEFDKKWEADPLITYQIDPFSIFYVGSSRDYLQIAPGADQPQSYRLADRQYFLKLQYLFRI